MFLIEANMEKFYYLKYYISFSYKRMMLQNYLLLSADYCFRKKNLFNTYIEIN